MKVDTIIVGQGIAGTALAYRLMQRDLSFVVIDGADPNAASKVASGLINPITGRNFVKSWMIDDLLPEAVSFYRSLSDLLGDTFIGDKPIIRSLDGAKQENQWYSRLSQPEYQSYIPQEYTGRDYEPYFDETFSFGQVLGSFNVSSRSLIAAFNAYLLKSGRLYASTFDHDLLGIADGIHYGDISAKRIIFAEGWRGATNPLFAYLPWRPAKGEVLICRIPDLPIDDIVKFHKFLVPLGDDLFWVGGTYEWDSADDKPTTSKREELIQYLDRYLKVSYEVVDHLAGIRPATKYRKPFIGSHPMHDNVHIFNGLGTKGFSLAPYWSNYLIRSIFDDVSVQHPDLPRLTPTQV